jgi:hypothetical protein
MTPERLRVRARRVAREAPDVLADRLIRRFIDAFNRARSKD